MEQVNFWLYVAMGVLILAVAVMAVMMLSMAARMRDLRKANEAVRQRLQHQDEGAKGMKGEQNINFYDKGGRLAFSTRISNVLYIESADNYANIHYLNEGKEDTFILHNSMKDIERDYFANGLLRCHRGYMVYAGNVKVLRKVRGGLQLELNHTARTLPVTKTYAAMLTAYFS